MSRYDLLPPNATPLERDVSRAVSSLQRVAPPVPIIRTAKRTNIPDSVVPWLIYEYGLGEILPYLGNDQRLALRDGVLWQRIRGTPESVRVALSWIGIEGLIEEPERGTTRWAEFMLGLSAATQGEEIIDRIAAVARISSPVRSRLQRIYAVYDLRRAVYDECDWDEGAIYDDHSGVRLRPDWPQISYGRVFSTYVALSINVGATQAPGYSTYLEVYPRFRWDEDQWDEGWHTLNPVSALTVQRGLSGRYEGQIWGAFRWLQDKPWPDVNVVVSSALNGTPTDSPVVTSISIGSTAAAPLTQGDVVSVSVVMSQAVVVTGTPQVALNVGGTTQNASYSSGSNTTTLVFTYAIQAGDNAVNGIAIPTNSITLNGGTISSVGGNSAVLTSNGLPSNNSLVVDAIAPPAPTLQFAASGVVTVSDVESGADWEYSVNGGTSWNGCPTTNFGLAPVCTDNFVLAVGTYATGTVRVRQIDAAGNVGTDAQNTTQITILDVTPPAAPVLTTDAANAQVAVTAEAGSTLSVVFSRVGGGTVTRSATGNGSTPVTLTLTSGERLTLGVGNINVSATATDAAGNTSTAGTASFFLSEETGPDFSNVELMIQGVTDIRDSSTRNRTLTVSGAVISTGQALFGPSSILFDGVNDKIAVSQFRVNQPYCLDFWFYTNTTQVEQGLVYANNSTNISIFGTVGGVPKQIVVQGGPAGGVRLHQPGDAGLIAGQWYHFRLNNDGTAERLFINGNLLSTRNDTIVSQGFLDFMHFGSSSNNFRWLNGNMIGIRVTAGTARSTTNFTVAGKLWPD